MPARTTRLVLSATSSVKTSSPLRKLTCGIWPGCSGRQVELGERKFLLHIVAVQRGGVEQPHLGADLADLQAACLQFHGVGVLQHDLVAALAMDLVGDDVQVEELHLL